MGDDLDELRREIKDLHRTHRQYINFSKEFHRRRRMENIQVLVALAIIGGILTLIAQESIRGTAQWLLTALIGFASVIFILIKTLIPPIIAFGDSDSITIVNESILDRISSFDKNYSFVLYAISLVSGLLLTSMFLLGTLVPVNRLTSELDRIIESIPFSELVPAILALAISLYLYNQHSKQRKRRDALSELREGYQSDHGAVFRIYGDWFRSQFDIESVHPRRVIAIGSYSPDIVAEDSSDNLVFFEFKLPPVRVEHIGALERQVESWNYDNETRNSRAVLVSNEFNDNVIDRIKQSSTIAGVKILPNGEEPILIQ